MLTQNHGNEISYDLHDNKYIYLFIYIYIYDISQLRGVTRVLYEIYQIESALCAMCIWERSVIGALALLTLRGDACISAPALALEPWRPGPHS